MLEITYKKQATKMLNSIQKTHKRRIVEAIHRLAENPERTDLDTKKLSGMDLFRLRVGDWRILYDVTGLILAIEKISSRGSAYKM